MDVNSSYSGVEGKWDLKEDKKEMVMENNGEEEEELLGLSIGEDDKKKRVVMSGVPAQKVAGGGGNISPPPCQAEKCTADMSDAKRYHRRHKVCEHHSKAPVVIVAGLRQRFCQQCSRFHELLEFDEAKRSCRRRLAGHNERRRKNSSESHGESSNRKGVGSELKENHCREATQSGRLQITLPENSAYKHFHIT